MTKSKLLCAAVAVLTLSSGAAWAQMSSQSGSMGGSAMSSDKMAGSMKMSKMDIKTMKSCQAMGHDMMMKKMKCKNLMAKHADMFNKDGTMKSDMMSPK